MSDLVRQVVETIQARQLLERGESVVVAVSGGLDSMVLLDVLRRACAEMEWRLVVAHLNHRLRGQESDADQQLVGEVSAELGLVFVCEAADVDELARNKGWSIEMAARELRHAFLARVARQHQCPVVALAHHAGDQVETFFVQLFRGAGGESLAGMKASSQSPASPGVRLVRPFLGIPRTELLRHAQCHSIRHREDSTNARTDFMRNRVRHELIPLIERDYQPALRRQVIRVMDVIGKESAYVREAAIRWLSSPAREEFGLLHPALQRQVVRIQLLRLGFDATYELAEHLRLRPGYRVMINPATVVWRETVGLICSREVVEPAFHQESAEVDLQAGQGEARFGGLCIAWRLSAADSAVDIKRTATQGQEVFDADRVGSPIGLRHWLPGDRFQPIGLGKPAKLQDLFTNSKVSRRRRRELVIATTASGELFWVDGLRIGERFKVQTGTSRFLRWSWRPAAQL